MLRSYQLPYLSILTTLKRREVVGAGIHACLLDTYLNLNEWGLLLEVIAPLSSYIKYTSGIESMLFSMFIWLGQISTLSFHHFTF
nr:hypothetical protein Q903MT_gene6102 [Picea sitchensis]